MKKKNNLEDLEKTVKHNFTNIELLEEALTHRSYLNEKTKWPYPHNERLEFLGDAVLELASTKSLYVKCPKEPEGKLTSLRASLVNTQMLAKVAKEINLGDYLYMSKGEIKDNGRERVTILANGMEALIGAIYLDGGFEEAFQFIEEKIMLHLSEIMEKGLDRDPKSKLQEIVQEKNRATPTYDVLADSGPDHAKIFKVGVFVDKKKIAEGTGQSKQEAETEAAKRALEKI